MAEIVRVIERDLIVIISINRPEVRNALSLGVIEKLEEIFSSLLDDEKTRAVLIHGEGDKAFCAGADLKERQKMGEQETMAFVERIQKTFQKLASLPMPTIAAINADAFGGGLELALACDIRVMSALAHVGMTECGWGIIPGGGGTQRLPKVVGASRAMELIFTCRRIGAEEALAMGLINFKAENSESSIRVGQKIAIDIAQNAPLAVRAAKEAIEQSQVRDIKSGLLSELACYHSILRTADRKEGLRAFQEKRAPQFLGK